MTLRSLGQARAIPLHYPQVHMYSGENGRRTVICDLKYDKHYMVIDKSE